MTRKLVHAGDIDNSLVEKVYRGGWSELILASEGGCIYCARAVCDHLLSCHKKVVVVGLCMSAATAIAACGNPTVSAPGTRFMVHFSASEGVEGKARELKSGAEELEVWNKWYLGLLATQTGTRREEWEELCNQETFFSAPLACRPGLVDSVS